MPSEIADLLPASLKKATILFGRAAGRQGGFPYTRFEIQIAVREMSLIARVSSG